MTGVIYFGWPEARETDAERAVHAGLAVAAAVTSAPVGGQQLQVRIGIATGLVVIGEPIGSGDSRQQTAVGETPNLAARLQGLAGPNQVVIDLATPKPQPTKREPQAAARAGGRARRDRKPSGSKAISVAQW